MAAWMSSQPLTTRFIRLYAIRIIRLLTQPAAASQLIKSIFITYQSIDALNMAVIQGERICRTAM
jgi:hypothetical protein